MIVSVRGLTKAFTEQRTWRAMLSSPGGGQKVTVVNNVSFDVAEGEVFGLLGQNGAGKTTIFKMLTTLILPDSGSATIDGYDVTRDETEVRRMIAPVIANERTLYWRLSAHENVRLFTALQGLRGAEARAEEARVLRVVGLADTGEKMVGMFSSGMRQRLLIARALIGRPRVLLLDEPTRSLDPISARDFREFLKHTVVEEERCTVLLATHDAEETWDLCNRVGVLERGTLLEVDATSTLRHRVGGDRYSAWIRTSEADGANAQLVQLGAANIRRAPSAEPEWTAFEFDVVGGTEGAARVLSACNSTGNAVARFERVAPSLADLIERVVKREVKGAHA